MSIKISLVDLLVEIFKRDLIESSSSWPCELVGHDDADNHTEESEGRPKNLHDKHRNERRRSLSMGERSSRANHADRKAADKVAETDYSADSEHVVARVLSILPQNGVSPIV